jgi:hypothetical protein
MKRLFALVLLFAGLSLSLVSCSTSTSPDGDLVADALPTRSVTGTLNVVAGSTLAADDLRVVTFAGASPVDTDGTFTVDVIDSDTYQWLLFVSTATGNPVYIGLYEPLARAVEADELSTAVALVLSNPYLVFTSHADRSEYIDQMKLSSSFATILSHLDAAWTTDAEAALDYTSNPVLYQEVARVAKWSMEMLGAPRGGRLPAPHIEDSDGADIALVNERHVWYAAGVQETDGTPVAVISVGRDASPDYAWGWPPTVTTTPEVTTYALGDGSFYVCMQAGDDFTAIGDWSDVVGRATCLNAAQASVHIVEIMTGYAASPGWQDFADYVSVGSTWANDLTLDLRQNKAERFVSDYCGLMSQRADDYADWFWEGVVPGVASEDFLEAGCEVFGNVSFVLDILSMVNDEGPFFWDWAYADENLCYEVSQTAGLITQLDDLTAPDPDFEVDPTSGVIGTVFEFDAATTIDDQDPLGSLEFRWDWDSDGTWDESWSSTSTTTHEYTASSAYTVTMQARDTDGLVGSVTHNVNVGGGAGTANHVKLFRDYLPWSSNATVLVLQSLGFTEGTGPDTYEIIGSNNMAVAALVPGDDLVIICNDQPQSFYDNYAASQIRFNSFVYSGGSLFWEACDQGWNYGSMQDAGIILPGSVGTIFDYDWYNYVVDPNLPLVAGLPEAMDHNYASHESFTNLPDGTTIYCRDESMNPTLVEYGLGGGWVILSGQPLEHQYENLYGDPDMEELLPRIVSHFTGHVVERLLPVKSPPISAKNPSHRG